MTKSVESKYTIGQQVEVLVLDFETPGANRSRFAGTPEVWVSGTITALDRLPSGNWAVEVTCDNGRPPIQYAVGEYGIKFIRAAHPSG